MCLAGEGNKDDDGGVGQPSPVVTKLVPRKGPPLWSRMLWTPLEYLVVGTTVGVGCAAVVARAPLDAHFPAPGTMASMVQGFVVVLQALLEGPRLQLVPIYVSSIIMTVMRRFELPTGMISGGVVLLLTSFSLLLCYLMPKLLPVGGRGPFAVGIATEHIRTRVPEIPVSNKKRWSLELMAQVFYPVDPLCVKKLPWFPYTLRRFRRSLVPAWGTARRIPFGLTQMSVVVAGIILGAARYPPAGPRPSLDTLLSLAFSSDMSSELSWVVRAAVALCLTCLASDLRQGSSRSGFKARYIGREAARRIARFANMPGWLTEHVCGFDGPGFDGGHFHAPDVPCFPVAPLKPGERKRPVVIFSHGLAGNRALYSEHAAEIASHGYIAVFVEHNDSSGSSCIFPDGRVTGYGSAPDPSNAAAPANKGFRLAQLKRRVKELELAQVHLSRLEKGCPTDFEACRRVGIGSVVDAKRPALVGHSFGGATVLQELNDRYMSNGEKMKAGYSMAFVMDAWTFPICDEAAEQCVKIPMVVITTDTFLGVEGAAREARLVDSAVCAVQSGENDLVLQIRVRDAEHNNFSDSALFAPRVMRKMKSVGKIDGVTFIDQVTRLLLCSLEVFLRRRTESGDVDRTSPPSDLASALLGADFPTAFPEARIERVCAGGVLSFRGSNFSSGGPE